MVMLRGALSAHGAGGRQWGCGCGGRGVVGEPWACGFADTKSNIDLLIDTASYDARPPAARETPFQVISQSHTSRSRHHSSN